MAHIKNIIFDLGGVLLDLDYHKTSIAFQKLGVTNFDELFSQFKANELFENIETGKISDEDFYDAVEKYCYPGTTRLQIEAAWNAMLLGFRVEALETLKDLRKKYRLFLLSNTNNIHLTAFKKIFTADTGLPSIDVFFDKAYYSHLIQMRKPYETTYHFVLDDAGIIADETLFIEDSIQNVEGARAVGIHTHLLLPAERIEDLHL
ncbi:HAD family hydrolase [Ferruginibacter sp. SUN002]|uniref:HAD family hydrolase n=1 Tax=Ferruginibacter sp. SUN002 TaxID=2937789 RepID=UPI003D35BC31